MKLVSFGGLYFTICLLSLNRVIHLSMGYFPKSEVIILSRIDIEGVVYSAREAWGMANTVYDSPQATEKEKTLALALAKLSYAVVKSHGGAD